MVTGFGIAILVGLAIILSGLKVLNEYERGVVFRLGRLMPERGPGIIFVIPIVERWMRVDLRVNTLEIAATTSALS
jgi:regulator of protease activity HflC (stomatin/prohibitin superfamily)